LWFEQYVCNNYACYCQDCHNWKDIDKFAEDVCHLSCEKISYNCSCGGKLRKGFCEVEFFGINFDMKECEICAKCNSEFLGEETMQEKRNVTEED
jgi:hypothetical protein